MRRLPISSSTAYGYAESARRRVRGAAAARVSRAYSANHAPRTRPVAHAACRAVMTNVASGSFPRSACGGVSLLGRPRGAWSLCMRRGTLGGMWLDAEHVRRCHSLLVRVCSVRQGLFESRLSRQDGRVDLMDDIRAPPAWLCTEETKCVVRKILRISW